MRLIRVRLQSHTSFNQTARARIRSSHLNMQRKRRHNIHNEYTKHDDTYFEQFAPLVQCKENRALPPECRLKMAT